MWNMGRSSQLLEMAIVPRWTAKMDDRQGSNWKQSSEQNPAYRPTHLTYLLSRVLVEEINNCCVRSFEEL